MNPTIELITSVEKFLALEPEWDRLLETSRSRNVFLTWEWISTWWDCFGTCLEPWVLTAREGPEGRLMGIAPFAVRRFPRAISSPYREAFVLGNGFTAADHLDIIADANGEREVVLAFTGYLDHPGWDVLRLDGIRGDSLLVASMRQRSSPRWNYLGKSDCPYIRLPARWDEYLGALDRRQRYNLRSRERRLEQESGGKVEFRRIEDKVDIDAAMSSLFDLHQNVRQAQGQSSRFLQPLQRKFHQKIAHRFHENGWLRLYLLTVDDRAIAASYCYRYGDVVYFFQTGFDRQWSRYGPGSAIIAKSIRESIEEGAHEFDFLRGAESYKLQWATDVRSDFRARIAPTGIGKLSVLAYRFGRGLYHVCRKQRRSNDLTKGSGA